MRWVSAVLFFFPTVFLGISGLVSCFLESLEKMKCGFRSSEEIWRG